MLIRSMPAYFGRFLAAVALAAAAVVPAFAAEAPASPPDVAAQSLPPNLVKAQQDLARQFDAEQTMRQHFVEALIKYQREVDAALRAAAAKASPPPRFVPPPTEKPKAASPAPASPPSKPAASEGASKK